MKEKNDKGEKFKEEKNILEKIFFESNNQESPSYDRDKLTKEWLAQKYIKTKTEYNQSQIYAITTLETLANQFFIKPLKELINNLRMNQLNKNRSTAKELVNIFKNNEPSNDENIRKWSKFLD